MEENKKAKTRINHLRHFNLAGIKIIFESSLLSDSHSKLAFSAVTKIISVKWNNDISIKQSLSNELQFSICFEVFVEFRGRKLTPPQPDEVVFESFAAQIKRQWWMAVKHWHSFPISVACQAQSLNHPLTRHVEKLIIHALWQSSFERLLILLMN